MNRFAKNLASCRKIIGLNQQELADKIGITKTQISRYETGNSFPRPNVIAALADALNISADKLLYGALHSLDVSPPWYEKLKRKDDIKIIPQEVKIRVSNKSKNQLNTFNTLITPSTTDFTSMQFVNNIKNAFLEYFQSKYKDEELVLRGIKEFDLSEIIVVFETDKDYFDDNNSN